MRLTTDRIQKLEAELNRIHNVSFCAINLDPAGAIGSVDIVSDLQRAPQRVVRDVEIILRRHGQDIDHRKIGVVQMDHPENLQRAADPAPTNGQSGAEPAIPAILSIVPDSERVRLAAVHSTTRDGSFGVEVELTLGSYEGVPGRAEGPGQDPASCVGLVAAATLEAVRNLLQSGYEGLVKEARILEVGGQGLILVVVDFGTGRETRRLAGSCIQRGSLYDAAVYATLDAINRPLGQARFRQMATLDVDDEGDGREPRAVRA